MTLEERIEELRELAKVYAPAQANRVYLTEYRKTKKSTLMKQAEVNGVKAIAAQERDAYSDPEYHEVLLGLKEATQAAELARWELVIAQMGLEAWRTQQANQRAERKGYGA